MIVKIYNKSKSFLLRRATPMVYVLVGVLFVISAYFLRSLFIELTTPNYNFYGTHYDFLAFFSAGKTILNHNISQLYDATNLTMLQRQIISHPVGASGYMPFLNPPFVAVFLAPLALFNINTARLVWLGISLMLAIFIAYKLTKPLKPKQRLLAVVLLTLSFPLYQTFIEGQLSILVLLSGCVSYLFFKRQQKLLSGASLVLLWVIPQFGVFTAIGLLVKREWQMLKGWLLSTLTIILVTLPFTGIKIYFEYVKVLASTTNNHFINLNTSAILTWRGALNMTLGLNGFYEKLIGTNHTKLVNMLYILTSITLVVILMRAIRKLGKKWSIRQEALIFSAALLIACVVDPHLYAQDAIVLLLLLPVLFIIYKQSALKAILIFAAFCNLMLLDQYSRVHFFTLTAVIIAIICTKQALPKTKKLI